MTRATLSAIFVAVVSVTGGTLAPTPSPGPGAFVFSAVTCHGRAARGGASFPCDHRLPLWWPGRAPEVRMLRRMEDATGQGPVVRCARCGGLLELVPHA